MEQGDGVNIKVTQAISLHLIPCIEFHLQLLKGNVVYLGQETFGFLNFLPHLTTLSNCTSLVWKTCFKIEITFLRWSTMDQDLASLVGGYGGIQRKGGSSNKNPQMNKVSLLYHLILYLQGQQEMEIKCKSHISNITIFE